MGAAPQKQCVTFSLFVRFPTIFFFVYVWCFFSSLQIFVPCTYCGVLPCVALDSACVALCIAWKTHQHINRARISVLWFATTTAVPVVVESVCPRGSIGSDSRCPRCTLDGLTHEVQFPDYYTKMGFNLNNSTYITLNLVHILWHPRDPRAADCVVFLSSIMFICLLRHHEDGFALTRRRVLLYCIACAILRDCFFSAVVLHRSNSWISYGWGRIFFWDNISNTIVHAPSTGRTSGF